MRNSLGYFHSFSSVIMLIWWWNLLCCTQGLVLHITWLLYSTSTLKWYEDYDHVSYQRDDHYSYTRDATLDVVTELKMFHEKAKTEKSLMIIICTYICYLTYAKFKPFCCSKYEKIKWIRKKWRKKFLDSFFALCSPKKEQTQKV